MTLRRALLALAFAALATAGFGVAAGVNVAMTSEGPVPERVTVAWGDTVVFTNADDGPHRITIPRLNLETPFVGPGGTLTHVFDGRRGSYGYRQLGSGPNRLGYVFVDVQGTVTLKASATIVRWGGSIRLTGTSSIKGRPVNIAGRVPGSGSAWVPAATVPTAADGSFSVVIKPQRGAQYRAQAAADQLTSPSIRVSVQPNLTLRTLVRRTATGKTITLVGRVAPASAVTMLDLQRLGPRHGRWLTEARKQMGRNGEVTFRWKALKGPTRLRVAARPLGLRSGWSEAFSKPVVVTGSSR